VISGSKQFEPSTALRRLPEQPDWVILHGIVMAGVPQPVGVVLNANYLQCSVPAVLDLELDLKEDEKFSILLRSRREGSRH